MQVQPGRFTHRAGLPGTRGNGTSWNKEGHPLPPEKCSTLSENFTVLRIREGEKSDCGFYSCNVSNVISWKEAALNLTVIGQPCPAQWLQLGVPGFSPA